MYGKRKLKQEEHLGIHIEYRKPSLAKQGRNATTSPEHTHCPLAAATKESAQAAPESTRSASYVPISSSRQESKDYSKHENRG